MTRKGELWRGDIAQRIEDYLDGRLQLLALTDWAMEHPFFEDSAELSGDEQLLIGHGLGAILQADLDEPEPSRTTFSQLRDTVELLWGRH